MLIPVRSDDVAVSPGKEAMLRGETKPWRFANCSSNVDRPPKRLQDDLLHPATY